jgi:hypothetical protein
MAVINTSQIFSPQWHGLDGVEGSLQSSLGAFFRNKKRDRHFAYALVLNAAHDEHLMIFVASCTATVPRSGASTYATRPGEVADWRAGAHPGAQFGARIYF